MCELTNTPVTRFAIEAVTNSHVSRRPPAGNPLRIVNIISYMYLIEQSPYAASRMIEIK